MATIMLVDDVELFLRLEKSFLEDCGYEVATAKSGVEALHRLTEVDPELILLDLYMPGIDGDEVCRNLKSDARWRDTPVIMVTSAGKEEEVQRCLSAGCDDYITKPVNKKDFLDKVQKYLSIRKRTDEAPSPVPLRVKLTEEGEALKARIRKLSRNGVYLRSRVVLVPGTLVQVSLALADGRVLDVEGKVKRVQEGGSAGKGVYFIYPEPHAQRELEKLVNTGEWVPPVAPPAESSPPPPEPDSKKALDPEVEEKIRLLKRIEDLERENETFANKIVRTEDINNNLTNLYVASTRLHSVLDRAEVLQIIKEVVINLVGAEKFAVLTFDKGAHQLRFEVGEGFDDLSFPAISPSSGLWQEVVHQGESYYQDGSVVEGSDDLLVPLAVIPLRIHEQTTGALAIYRLFVQKERFEVVDFQLFSMMAEHAATAIFSSTLYEESERKRQTYRGFMDLLLK